MPYTSITYVDGKKKEQLGTRTRDRVTNRFKFVRRARLGRLLVAMENVGRPSSNIDNDRCLYLL